jgi:hypothetical protein
MRIAFEKGPRGEKNDHPRQTTPRQYALRFNSFLALILPHDDVGADRHAVEQIDDVVVDQAEAA